MSKVIATSAIQGAHQFVAAAEKKLAEAIRAKGEACPVAFPSTAYFLPVVYSFTGMKVSTLGDMKPVLARAKGLLPRVPADKVWLPYLGSTLDAGVAALFACELIEACKYVIGPNPVEGIWLGAANDVIMRERGIEFVDGSAPGFAAVTGAAPTNKIAVQIARELQEKNLYVFMGGCTSGVQFAEQLAAEGVQLGWETRLVPFGRDVSSLIYALGFANRAALSFGGVHPGDFKANLRYNQSRIFAFVLALGEVTDEKYAAAAGAINFGFPVIADTDIPQILPTGVCTYEHVVSNVPHGKMVEKALEVRGCKVKITSVPIPVAYGPAFEGERIRKQDARVEFGGQKSTAFEFVTSAEVDAITDGRIEVIGPDIDAVLEGTVLPLAIWVEAAGRKMQTDFEPILERQIHHLLNGAEGLWHMGQRDIVWTRVSKAAFARGFRLRHYGEILHARLLADYPAIVDKVQVTLITDAAEVEKRLATARRVYDERNRRLESMTDESVDTFYSCLLCQSFAPNHVCIITPERLGLCGAYNWLDGNATGPNQPVRKGDCLDPVKGVWQGINDYVWVNSHKTLPAFSAYSIMDRPMTSCGCFEAIVAYVPECNGVMIVNREFQLDTPVGMTFSSLAGSVGGGQQTPGFLGVGKVFLSSKKFIYAEGGHQRIVWMPKELKELLKADLELRFQEQGAGDLFDKIADETVATAPAEIRAFMEKNNHPALKMPDMAEYAGHADTPTAAPEQKAAEVKQDEAGAKAPSAAQPAGNSEQKPAPATAFTERDIEALKDRIVHEVKHSITKEIVDKIILTLKRDVLGEQTEPETKPRADELKPGTAEMKPAPKAADAVGRITAFRVRKEKCELPVWTVKLGATKSEGGTRGRSLLVGGATCMPFHLWEGEMPHRPLVALEVFDTVSPKYPEVLRKIYGGLLENPAAMARNCVEKLGADLVSVRLEGTHPEKGDRSPEDAVKLVKEILSAVDVPLIITGHNHFEKNNEVMKAIAQGCAGENLLLNWVEQNNYRTIAGAAVAYGHTIVAQSPIDVNIGKQLNILLTNMDLKKERIVMDPLTGAMGYGLEYTYSVMERIRLTGLGGDAMLAGPLIVSPGYECAKVKETRAAEKDFPAWGNLEKRAELWELATATSLLYAGADILVMYHPAAMAEIKKTILALMDSTL
jgi:acetyl-CoA synthase